VRATEGTQKRCLSDSRFAADDDYAAVAPRPDRRELTLELRKVA
jgi:hypothetical protein